MNKTEERHLGILENNPNHEGVGLFIRRNGTHNLRRYVKEIVPDITYRKFLNSKGDSVMMKFIPYKVNIKINNQNFFLESFESIPMKKWVCEGECNQYCLNNEICLCIQGQCY